MNQEFENILAKYLCGESSDEEKQFVEKWKLENPGEYEKYQKAFSYDIYHEIEFNAHEALNQLKYQDNKHLSVPTFIKKWYLAAAIFAGIMAIGTILLLYSQSLNVYYANETSSKQQIDLPDGSTVILAANSSLFYSKNWDGKFNRDVELNGKAYFLIEKDISQPFSVITKQVNITVLGTRFMVNEIEGKTQVVLTEGKIQLSTKAYTSPVILENEGDQLIVNDQEIIKHNNIQIPIYMAWVEQKLYFNKCTVKDIVDLLEDSYDIKLNIDGTSLLDKKLFGSAPSDDPELIMQALSEILQTEIKTY